MKAFVIAYNRLTLIKNIAERLYNIGLDVRIVDNHSDNPSLLEWYEEAPYGIIRMDKNYGHQVVWSKVLYPLAKGERYIVTDPDLDLSDVPDDFVSVLNAGLDKYPNFHKCGLSLRIDDLPDTEIGNQAKSWEQQFWKHKLDNMYYAADVDTTLALYRENVTQHTLNALRVGFPYSARHIPWYYTTFDSLPADEQYYYSSLGTYTYWAKYMKQ